MTVPYEPQAIVLDFETTGLDRRVCQIIECSIRWLDGPFVDAPLSFRCRPSIPIEPGATEVHGISDADVAAELPFKEFAHSIRGIVERAHAIVGYGINFDLEVLNAELERNEFEPINLRDHAIVDLRALWSAFEPRTLQSAHRYFTGSGFDDAHSADADTAATARVFAAMRSMFSLHVLSWAQLAQLGDPSPDRRTWAGPTDDMVWRDGSIVMNFGKFAGLDIYEAGVTARGFLTWVVNPNRDFPRHVKRLCVAALRAAKNSPPTPRAEFYAWASKEFPPP